MTKSRGINRPRAPWTPEQDAVLKARYPHEKTERIALDIGRPLSQVYQRAAKHGLSKSPEYLASPDACRLRKGDNVGAAHRFKKGMATWNKGMKGLQIGGEETQFKAGQMPHNTKEIGAYRITKDGTLQRKISNAKGNNSVRWRGVHELVWTDANGPVPHGHIVVFKPGMRTNELTEITLDKVECISFAENMRRNTYHNYGKDIAQLVQLKGAITRQINRREKSK